MQTFRIAALCLALAPLVHAGDEDGTYVWTGKRGMFERAPRVVVEVTSYGKDSPNEVRRIPPDAHANALRAELAQLRLAEATDGPSPELETRRLELWIRACDGEPFEGQGELLVELALDRAERLAQRGAGEAALEATQELLLPERLLEAAGEFELAPADAAWLERTAAWLTDPRLAAMRAKLTPPQDTAPVSADVEDVIWQHIKDENSGAVLQFGARAIPVLETYVRRYPSMYPARGEVDPLTLLFASDEERGALFVLELVDVSGEVFPLRVLRSMRAAGVLRNADTWRETHDGYVDGLHRYSTTLRQPLWRDILERLVTRPELAADACQEVAFLVSMDALSPALAQFLVHALRGEDANLHQKALLALDEAGGRPSARPMLTELLANPSADVRAAAARCLTDFDECPELWPMAEDPELAVRLAVVEALTPRQQRVLVVRGVGGVELASANGSTLRGLDHGGLPALERLIHDPEPAVYQAAIRIPVRHEDVPLPVEALRPLTGHADEGMRVMLPYLRFDGLPDAQILAALAEDPDAKVRNAVDMALNDVAVVGAYPTSERPLAPGWSVFHMGSSPWSDAFLPALVRRLEHEQTVPRPLQQAPSIACRTQAGARALAALARDTQSHELRDALVSALYDQGVWSGRLAGWHLVEPDTIRDVLAAAWRSAPDLRVWGKVRDALATGPAALQAAGMAWCGQTQLPWSVRLLGLQLAAPIADDVWRARLGELLADAPQLEAQSPGWGVVLRELGGWLSDRALAARLLADLVASREIPEELLGGLLAGLCTVSAPDPESARIAIERWCEVGGRFDGIVTTSLAHVRVTEERPEAELFERLLGLDNSGYVQKTLRAMGRLHLKAHLPLLERALLGEFGATADLRRLAQVEAALALACYLDDEAAELLLRGVGSTSNAEVRETCFTALDTIRRYQDERARWNARADSKQARAEAIAELVGLIETGEGVQRVEAVRALGTLEAVEELPRLVRLTGSKDAALAKAAKETLDAIRRAQERKQD